MNRTRKPIAALALGLALALASAAAFAAGTLSDYARGAILGHAFKGVAWSAPATLYAGLSTTACSATSVGTEVTGGSYARVPITAATGWSGPAAGTGRITNAAAVTFPAPTSAWNVVSHWHLSDAATGGNLIACAPLDVAKTINAGDAAPAFPAGALYIQLGPGS